MRLEQKWYLESSVRFSVVPRIIFVLEVDTYGNAATNSRRLRTEKRMHVITAVIESICKSLKTEMSVQRARTLMGK